MFSWLKRKLVGRKVIKDITPLMRVINLAHGRADQVVFDPYIMGFIMGSIMILMTIYSNKTIRGAELGRLQYEIAQEIFGEDALRICNDSTLFRESKTNSEFNQGQKNAVKAYSFMHNMNLFLDDPDVIMARNQALEKRRNTSKSRNDSGENIEICVILIQNYFFKYLLEKHV